MDAVGHEPRLYATLDGCFNELFINGAALGRSGVKAVKKACAMRDPLVDANDAVELHTIYQGFK